MLTYHHGENILEAQTQALVNPVNCVGVMGAGLALQFKKAFPAMFSNYKRVCKSGSMQPGTIHPVRIQTNLWPLWIVNFPTKNDWRNPSRLEYIWEGLTSLEEFIEILKIQSISIPPLGCGLGGLPWKLVLPLIKDFDRVVHPCHTHIFTPWETA